MFFPKIFALSYVLFHDYNWQQGHVESLSVDIKPSNNGVVGLTFGWKSSSSFGNIANVWDDPIGECTYLETKAGADEVQLSTLGSIISSSEARKEFVFSASASVAHPMDVTIGLYENGVRLTDITCTQVASSHVIKIYVVNNGHSSIIYGPSNGVNCGNGQKLVLANANVDGLGLKSTLDASWNRACVSSTDHPTFHALSFEVGQNSSRAVFGRVLPGESPLGTQWGSSNIIEIATKFSL